MSTFFSLFAFSRKGETDGIFFLLLQKENVWQKKRDRGNLSDGFPGPLLSTRALLWTCGVWKSGIYDRLCRGRCRAQLFAMKERYRCGLPLAGTHRPCGRAMPAPTDSIAVPVVNVGATIGRPLKAPLSGEPSRGSRGFDWEGRLTRGGLETIIKFPTWTRHSVILRSRGTNGWNRNTYHL